MFGNFSFRQAATAVVADGSSTTTTTSTVNSTAVSPTSTRSSSPSLHLLHHQQQAPGSGTAAASSSSSSILELSRQFSEHSIDQCLRQAPVIRPVRQQSADPSSSSSSSPSYHNNNDNNTSSISTSVRSSRSSINNFSPLPSTTTTMHQNSDMSSTAVRLQRQAHTRMMAENTHLRDISTLVQRMIDDGDQCTTVCAHPAEEAGVAGKGASSTVGVGAAAAAASDSGSNDEITAKAFGRGHKRAASAVLPYAVKHRKFGDAGHVHATKTMRVRKQVSDRAMRRCR